MLSFKSWVPECALVIQRSVFSCTFDGHDPVAGANLADWSKPRWRGLMTGCQRHRANLPDPNQNTKSAACFDNQLSRNCRAKTVKCQRILLGNACLYDVWSCFDSVPGALLAFQSSCHPPFSGQKHKVGSELVWKMISSRFFASTQFLTCDTKCLISIFPLKHVKNDWRLSGLRNLLDRNRA